MRRSYCVTSTVAAAVLFLIILGCGRAPAPEMEAAPSVGNTQVGVAVSAPTQPGWSVVKSSDRETRFEKPSEVDPAVASSRMLPGTTFGGGDDLLASVEAWKEAQLAATSGLKHDSLHFNRVEFKERTCLQYDGSFEVVSDPKNPFTRFNFKGYLCPLGDSGPSVVELEVSNHSTQKGFSDDLNRFAKEFFEGAVLRTASPGV